MEAKNETSICQSNVNGEIESRILTVRGMQVMLDRDLAELYGVPTKALNQAVKRNSERFPTDFMFRLSESELEVLRSQIVTSKRGGNRYRPYAFTEHGVTMLASVLKSSVAIEMSIRIVKTFVSMKRFMMLQANVFDRIEKVEQRQIIDQSRNDERFEKVFKALDKRKESTQGVFYDGQLWDARSLVEQLIARAKTSILLIDNWVGVGTLDMLAKKGAGVTVTIVTSEHRDRKGNPRPTLSPTDLATFNAQYPALSVEDGYLGTPSAPGIHPSQGKGDTVFVHAHRRVREANFRNCGAVGLLSRLGADNPRGVPRQPTAELRFTRA